MNYTHTTKKYKLAPGQREEIVARYVNGEKIKDLAEEFKLDRSTVNRYLTRANISVRPKHEECRRYPLETFEEKRRRFKEYNRSRVLGRYGLTTESYDQLLAQQQNRCPICNCTFSDNERPFIDHCHETGKTRGLLHSHCNLLLGHAKDSVATLNRAIEYLRKHQNL